MSHKPAHAVPIRQAPASTRKTKARPANEGRAVEGAFRVFVGEFAGRHVVVFV